MKANDKVYGLEGALSAYPVTGNVHPLERTAPSQEINQFDIPQGVLNYLSLSSGLMQEWRKTWWWRGGGWRGGGQGRGGGGGCIDQIVLQLKLQSAPICLSTGRNQREREREREGGGGVGERG